MAHTRGEGLEVGPLHTYEVMGKITIILCS